MDLFKKILDMYEKGINGPYSWILITVSTAILFYRIFLSLHKIKSYSDFDRLFFPKNEKGIQEKLSKLIDYITFFLLYFIFGAVNSIIFSKWINISIHSGINDWINWSFSITLYLLMFKVATKNTRLDDKLKTLRWSNFLELGIKFSFNINYYLSFAVYIFSTHFFLFGNYKHNSTNVISYSIVLFLLSIFLLFLYRSYNKKNKDEYACTIINEEEFNDSRVIIFYTLDKDRMVFRKPNDTENSELYMYDRSSDKYFKFTKVNTI